MVNALAREMVNALEQENRRSGALVLKCFEARMRFECCACAFPFINHLPLTINHFIEASSPLLVNERVNGSTNLSRRRGR